jgi:hypothetical protein
MTVTPLYSSLFTGPGCASAGRSRVPGGCRAVGRHRDPATGPGSYTAERGEVAAIVRPPGAPDFGWPRRAPAIRPPRWVPSTRVPGPDWSSAGTQAGYTSWGSGTQGSDPWSHHRDPQLSGGAGWPAGTPFTSVAADLPLQPPFHGVVANASANAQNERMVISQGDQLSA